MTTTNVGSNATDANAGAARHLAASLGKCYVVPVATACNAACSFCATLEYAPQVARRMLLAKEVYAIAQRLSAAGATRFEVTGGGEPALHPQLAEILLGLQRGAPPALIKLYTNGARPAPYALVDEVNISRAALEPAANDSIMHIRGGSPTIDRIVAKIRSTSSATIRLSMPLVVGGLDSVEKILATVRAVESLVDGVVLRPLYPATPNRSRLFPALDVGDLVCAVEREFGADAGFTVEVDSDGCFRAAQTILAADGCVYTDWGLAPAGQLVV